MPSYDSRRHSLAIKEFAPSGSFLGSGCRNHLSGLSLDDVISNKNKPQPPPASCHPPSEINRTLLKIFRDQDPGNRSYKDKKAWRKFKDRLRLEQAAAAWTLRGLTSPSDIPFQNSGSFLSESQKRRQCKGFESDKFCRDHCIMAEENSHGGENQTHDLSSQGGLRPMMMRRVSTRHNAPVQATSDPDEPMPESTPDKASLRPPMLRHNSTKMGSMRCDSTRSFGRSESSLLGKDDHPYADPDLIGYGSESGRMSRRMLTTSTDDRLMSAREAAAAQEASEAEAAAAREEEKNGGMFVQEMMENQQQERMSLMDLLEQTDEQMGWTGSRYMIGDEDEDEDEEDNEEEVDNDEEDAGEKNCSVCQVKHKGPTSGPCGHSFCRLCSKELRVGNGHCPACNDFNQEIIEVF